MSVIGISRTALNDKRSVQAVKELPPDILALIEGIRREDLGSVAYRPDEWDKINQPAPAIQPDVAIEHPSPADNHAVWFPVTTTLIVAAVVGGMGLIGLFH